MYAYNELQSKFQRSTNPNKTEYKLENNTYTYKYQDTFEILLHGSIIAKITLDKIILGNCGWMTFTTKNRLNKILDDNQVNYRICQVKFTWYLYPTNWGIMEFSHDRIEFYNGITFIYCLNRLHGNAWYINGYIE